MGTLQLPRVLLQPLAARWPSAAQPCSGARLQISLSSFAFLFSELVQYCQSRVSNISELERK